MHKRSVHTIALLSVLFAFSQCSKKGKVAAPGPVANFSYTGAGLAPASVTFTSTSVNASSYSWDFGDNGSSTLANPTHTYTQGGVYTVKLTTIGAGGSNSIVKTVNIQAPTSVKIISIKLTGMPFTDAVGAGWDNNSGPDVFLTLDDQNDATLATSGTFANVAAIPPNLNWNLTPAVQIINFAATYKIRVYDEDINDIPPSPNDFIGGYTFNFTSAANNGYPTTLILQIAGNPLKIEVGLLWQ